MIVFPTIGYDYYLTTDAEGVVHSQWEDPRDVGMILQADSSTSGEGGNYVHDNTTTTVVYDTVVSSSSSSSSQGMVVSPNKRGMHTTVNGDDDSHLRGVDRDDSLAPGQGLDQSRIGEEKNGQLPSSTSTGSLASAAAAAAATNVQQGNFSSYLSSPPRSPTNRTLTNGTKPIIFGSFFITSNSLSHYSSSISIHHTKNILFVAQL